jgi:hypothetical protein
MRYHCQAHSPPVRIFALKEWGLDNYPGFPLCFAEAVLGKVMKFSFLRNGDEITFPSRFTTRAMDGVS